MIQILWEHIKKDVDKRTWAIANVRIEDIEQRGDAQTDESRGSVMLVMRFAEDGAALIANSIFERMARRESVTTSTDAISSSKVSWTFELKSDVNVNEDALSMIIHKCMVDYILFRWSEMYAADMVKSFENDYISGIGDIVKAVFTMGTPKKKKRQVTIEENNITFDYE